MLSRANNTSSGRLDCQVIKLVIFALKIT